MATHHSRTVGIIGAGNIVFRSHLPIFKALGLSVSWILDSSLARAEATARAFDIPFFVDERGLPSLAETDIVLLACPYGARHKYYEYLHVGSASIFVEKPVARSVAEFARICELRPDYAIAAGFLRRSMGVVALVKSLIAEGMLGRLRHVRSDFGTATTMSGGSGFAKNVRLAGGGQLFESAIHNIDSICYMVGVRDAAVEECRMIHENGFDLHTTAKILLTDQQGAAVEMDLLVTCFQSTNYEIEMSFDHGTLSFSLFRNTPPIIRVGTRSRGYRISDPMLGEHPVGSYDVMAQFWREFLVGIDARQANHTSLRTTWATTSIIEQLYRKGGCPNFQMSGSEAGTTAPPS